MQSTITHQKLVSIDHQSSPQEALRMMDTQGIHHLVVTKNGKSLGVVSDRDLYRSLLSKETNPSPFDLGKLAFPSIATINRQTTLKEAIEWMIDHKKAAIPISEGGQIVGLVTSTDLIQALYHHLSQNADLDKTEISFLEKSRAAINDPLSNPLVVNLMQLLSEAGI